MTTLHRNVVAVLNLHGVRRLVNRTVGGKGDSVAGESVIGNLNDFGFKDFANVGNAHVGGDIAVLHALGKNVDGVIGVGSELVGGILYISP